MVKLKDYRKRIDEIKKGRKEKLKEKIREKEKDKEK